MSILLALMFLFSVFNIQAEELYQDEIYLPGDIYLLPQTIYAGDRGRLVVSLGSAFIDARAFVLETRDELLVINNHAANDLVINRIELERRGSNIRLLVDFIPYAPGVFVLPPVAIPSGDSDSLMLGGIEFTVASILTSGSMTLSRPAPPLAVPGTGLMVYGGLGGLFLFLILGIILIFRLHQIINPLRKRWKQKRFLTSLEQKIRLLRDSGAGIEQQGRNELFSNLAGEFREFLSFITGFDCCVLTPYEFTSLSVAIPGAPGQDFFYALFKRWDKLRFSGIPIKREDILEIMDKLDLFFTGFINAEKNK